MAAGGAYCTDATTPLPRVGNLQLDEEGEDGKYLGGLGRLTN